MADSTYADGLRRAAETLTEPQREIVLRILDEGKAELSKDSSADYIAAAAFVFDNGLLWHSATILAEAQRAGE